LIERIAEILGLDEREIHERLRYLNITDEDINNLREIYSKTKGRGLKEIFEKFYRHLLEFPETREILEREEGLIDRLKSAQERHFKELVEGNFNLDYALKRLKVGLVHEERGVDPKYFTGAFSKWVEITLPLIFDKRDPQKSAERILSFFKAVLFDIVLSLEAYYFSKILRARDVRYSAIFENAFDGIIVADLDSFRIVEANQKALEILSAGKFELLGSHLWEIHPPEKREVMEVIYRSLRDRDQVHETVELYNRRSEERIPCEAGLRKFTVDNRNFIICELRDLREKVEREEKLRRINSLYDALSGINTLVTIVKDVNYLFNESVRIIKDKGKFKYAGIYAKDSQEVITSAGDYNESDTSVCISINSNSRRSYYLLVSRHERDSFTMEEVGLLYEIAHDLSFGLSKISTEKEIMHLKFYDELTNLPNRTYFNNKLKELVAIAEGKREEVGLLVFDIDHFSETNQAMGHSYGDLLLKAVATRLRSIVRQSDFLARIGADEFAIIIVSKEARISIDKLVERIKSNFSDPVIFNSHELFVTFSFGASFYPSDTNITEVLHSEAIASLEKAKNLGGNRYVPFSSEVNVTSKERIKLRTDLRKSFDKKEFVLYFQPKVNLQTEKVEGAEALLRWIKDGQIIPPTKFLPILEESELIHEIGEWVIIEACEHIKKWSEKGILNSIAVNVSPIQLRIPSLANKILFLISQKGTQCENIEVEITESALMEDTSVSVEFLNTLTSYGIRTYIDDFGTGYSSLAYLKKLPVYALKIDREFIKDLPHDRDDIEIVKATILLAKTFGLKTVAEGVETREQVELLKDLGCDYAQGYYFAKPMNGEEFEEYVLRRQG